MQKVQSWQLEKIRGEADRQTSKQAKWHRQFLSCLSQLKIYQVRAFLVNLSNFQQWISQTRPECLFPWVKYHLPMLQSPMFVCEGGGFTRLPTIAKFLLFIYLTLFFLFQVCHALHPDDPRYWYCSDKNLSYHRKISFIFELAPTLPQLSLIVQLGPHFKPKSKVWTKTEL